MDNLTVSSSPHITSPASSTRKIMLDVIIALCPLVIAAVLFFGFIFVAAAPRFYTDRMVWDNAARFPLLNPVTYTYEDIRQVYYIEGRINVYDELVERGSYVLVFGDGTAVDLDGSLSVGTEKYFWETKVVDLTTEVEK